MGIGFEPCPFYSHFRGTGRAAPREAGATGLELPAAPERRRTAWTPADWSDAASALTSASSAAMR
jgi:hypothetical protein